MDGEAKEKKKLFHGALSQKAQNEGILSLLFIAPFFLSLLIAMCKLFRSEPFF